MRRLAAVTLAMRQEHVAQFVTVPTGGFHGMHQAAPLEVVARFVQRGGSVILLVHCQSEGQDDAISFLTGHYILSP